MTFTTSIVRQNTFYDSLKLMRITKKASELSGVSKVAVVMGSDTNKGILTEIGLLTDGCKYASANDLIISLSAETQAAATAAIGTIETMLVNIDAAKNMKVLPKSIETAFEQVPNASMAMISVPGPYAAKEARKALDLGLNVFLFSDGVSLKDELLLKETAKRKNLLMMGPGCGTAIIDGVALGFANAVNRGPIGIVGAAGTGIQQVTTLIHQMGSGISQAIGTGGRDLSDDIGGIMMQKGIEMLEKDEQTKIIVLISKPPGKSAEQAILKTSVSKPIVVCFIGGTNTVIGNNASVQVKTLEEAATTAVELAKNEIPKQSRISQNIDNFIDIAEKEWVRLKSHQLYVRGLFSGGTLCSESMIILSKLLGDVYSNTTKSEFRLENAKNSKQNTCLDMGEEEFTSSRPHPMIDPFLRKQRLIQEAKDPETAVILVDVVLGYGSHIDPAGELADAISSAKSQCEKEGRYISVVASVIGTDGDPQILKKQVDKLVGVGVVVMESNAQAAMMAALIASRGDAKLANTGVLE